ncbi:hypothetical protein CALCODRAFT_529505 [Calocera cornea HHB12733]|uniref:Uncharacterized protein n=1 Tax=Calocera cornea HHB12733 TaxID=1353952 RepID=A0A165DNQ1_9BASI|nr:hypothetical protein CALCODRAFT_529505 [Calocera cornea HHB12733]
MSETNASAAANRSDAWTNSDEADRDGPRTQDGVGEGTSGGNDENGAPRNPSRATTYVTATEGSVMGGAGHLETSLDVPPGAVTRSHLHESSSVGFAQMAATTVPSLSAGNRVGGWFGLQVSEAVEALEGGRLREANGSEDPLDRFENPYTRTDTSRTVGTHRTAQTGGTATTTYATTGSDPGSDRFLPDPAILGLSLDDPLRIEEAERQRHEARRQGVLDGNRFFFLRFLPYLFAFFRACFKGTNTSEDVSNFWHGIIVNAFLDFCVFLKDLTWWLIKWVIVVTIGGAILCLWFRVDPVTWIEGVIKVVFHTT